MVRAFILVDASAGTATDLAAAIGGIEGVVSADVITGPFDVMVEFEGEAVRDVIAAVTGDIRVLEGVGTTRTYVVLD